MRGEEAAYVLAKSRARILFCAGTFLGNHYPTMLAPHRPRTLETIIVIRDAKAGDYSWFDFMDPESTVRPDAAARRAELVEPGDTMDIMFTSGTTGQPKGVVTAHEQNLRAIAE